MSITIDPEFRDLIPPLLADERAQLEANILADGCRDPLVLWGEVLVDGHNRYEICREHGIEFNTVQCLTITSREDAVLWIVRHQLGRRNISDFVRTELALRLKPVLESQARARQQAGEGVPANSPEGVGETREEIARVAGVGSNTVSKVEKIKKNAAPEIIEKVRAGEISINAAEKASRLPQDQQRELAKEGPKAIQQAAKAAAAAVEAPIAMARPHRLGEAEGGSPDCKLRWPAPQTLEDLRDENEWLRRVVESTKTSDPFHETVKWAEYARDFDLQLRAELKRKGVDPDTKAEEDDGPSLSEIVDEQQAEIARLTVIVEALQVDDQKAELIKRVKLAQMAERRRDEAMDATVEAQNYAKFLKRQLQRCGRAVGETDPDKVAPKVEAALRAGRVGGGGSKGQAGGVAPS